MRVIKQYRVLILTTFAALAAFLALPSSPALAVTIIVDTTSDSSLTACTGSASDCSLRGAITNANGSGAADTIFFDAGIFPSGTPATINIASSLPNLSGGGDTINGLNRGVIIDGVSRGFDCINIFSAGNTISGLQITDCNKGIDIVGGANDNIIGPLNTIFDNSTGISFGSTDGNSIIGNKIGTNVDGTAAPTPNNVGVLIQNSDNNTIGGTKLIDRNIISGGVSTVVIENISSGNVVIGNYIGTDVTGTVDLGGSTGVRIQNSAFNNVIGGTGPGEGNLISGHSSVNVNIRNIAINNTVSGNIIGPDMAGSGAAMTNGTGVSISATTGNTIGPGNVISDNANGVNIFTSGTQGNTVKGNLIGTDLSGTAGVPNSAIGVLIQSEARFNTIGGTTPGDGNVIAHNGSDGVRVNLSGTISNPIRGNSIHSNSGLPINNLSGGNLELPPPTLTSSDGVSLSGTACPFCEVDIFSDSASDPRIYEGSATAGVGGNFTFVAASSLVGPNLVATQTNISGNTSEVTSSIAVIDNDADGIGDAADPDDDNDGLPDVNDLCPLLAEDFDGFDDADGCPDTDNDNDGIPDTSDSGKMVFDPAGTIPAPTIDCSNIPEDYDGFKDSDGCPEPDNDNDGFPDAIDDCPGTDAHAGADGMLGSPEDLDHSGIQNGGESALTTDDSVLVFEDYDGVIDTDGCHDSPGDDFDGDSLGLGDPFWFRDEIEVFIGTNPLDACADTSAPDDEAVDKLPADLNDDQAINVLDRARMVFQLLSLTYDQRFDLNADGFLNVQDRAIEVLYVLNFQPLGGVCTSL